MKFQKVLWPIFATHLFIRLLKATSRRAAQDPPQMHSRMTQFAVPLVNGPFENARSELQSARSVPEACSISVPSHLSATEF